MVEVTKSNFHQIFPDIEEAITNASFIAIDAEFTGLTLGADNNISLFDSMNDRYKKLRARATSFTVSQIGLSAFTKDPSQNCYKVKTYIFYIRPYLCGSIDKKFLSQASCLDFLCRYDFDFNKFIKEGIPFINDYEEQLLFKELEDGSIVYPYDLLKREDDLLINNEFFGSFKPKKDSNVRKAGNKIARHAASSGKKITIPKDISYPEYFQLSQIRRKYPTLWACVENDMVTVQEVTAEEKQELLKSCEKEKENVLNFFLGFTQVFRLLKKAQKPIVGHNFTMDLLLFYHNFHQPLPDKYEEFKKELHSFFPWVYDTRHIWRHVKRVCNLKDIPKFCGLFELHEMFKRPPNALTTLYNPRIEIVNGDKYAGDAYPHEAGYDSYITGWVFLHICHVLAMSKVKSSVFNEPQTFKQHINAVAPFINKINIARSRYSYINLAGNDPPPTVPELLHVSRREKSILNEMELSQTFSKYGSIDIKLLGNKREAIIVVGGFGCFRDILRDFKDHDELVVSKYNVFKHSYLRNVLWGTALGSACFVGFLFVKMVKD